MMAACIPTLRVLFRETQLPTSQAYKLSNGYSFKGSRTNGGIKDSRLADEPTPSESTAKFRVVETMEDER